MKASIVIRTLNEAKRLGELLTMVSRQKTELDVEVVVIDSGSTDGTLEIAEHHGCEITHISKSVFSFGRSLNQGCEYSTGDFLILISGHCVPTDENWLQNLCQPLLDGKASYSYGRQIGDDNSNYAERRIFAKYFPATSSIPQEGFFCNNANSAIVRSAWAQYQFDEELTGLEDMELAKRIHADGHKIAYVADAQVFHLHEETWAQIRRRFEREAIALRDIMPEVHLNRFDIIHWFLRSAWKDWRAASRNGLKGLRSAHPIDMLRYRWNQYVGSYKGNHQHRYMSQLTKQRYFYPEVHKNEETDEWLKSVRRAPAYEGKQSED